MTKRIVRRRPTLCWKHLLASVFVVATTLLVVDAAAGPFHLVAVLPSDNFSDWTAAFQEAVAAQDGGSAALGVPGVAVSAAGGVRSTLGDVCAAAERHNETAMLVVGDQSMINSVLVVAQHLSVPLLGYNLDRRSAVSPVCAHHSVSRTVPYKHMCSDMRPCSLQCLWTSTKDVSLEYSCLELSELVYCIV